jgi:hypothetical protein
MPSVVTDRANGTQNLSLAVLSPAQRFLSNLMQVALASDWRTPQQYFEHFGTRSLLEKLESDPPLRAKILIQATGVDERLALRKSAESAAEDLELALEEGLTDPSKLLALLPQEDQIRHLRPLAVWEFLTHDGFWKVDAEPHSKRAVAVRRVLQLLRAALDSGVLSLREVAYGVGLKRIATCLPQPDLQRIVENAFSRARAGQSLSEDELLSTIPLESLVEFVPLEHTWREVVEQRLLRGVGLGVTNGSADAPPSEVPPMTNEVLPRSLFELQQGLETPGEEELENLDEVLRVCEVLQAVGRLPNDASELSLAVLLSIESMYGELENARDEMERARAVREAFPNDALLRAGVTSLLRLLNPDVSEDALRQATSSALVNGLLYEEDRINRAHEDALYAGSAER